MTKEEVGARIEEFGIIPAIRLSSTADARFAAEAVYRAGLPIAEITMTVPGALALISVVAAGLSGTGAGGRVGAAPPPPPERPVGRPGGWGCCSRGGGGFGRGGGGARDPRAGARK